MKGHRTLGGRTPAMVAGLAPYKLDMRWLVTLMDEMRPPVTRGPYGTIQPVRHLAAPMSTRASRVYTTYGVFTDTK